MLFCGSDQTVRCFAVPPGIWRMRWWTTNCWNGSKNEIDSRKKTNPIHHWSNLYLNMRNTIHHQCVGIWSTNSFSHLNIIKGGIAVPSLQIDSMTMTHSCQPGCLAFIVHILHHINNNVSSLCHSNIKTSFIYIVNIIQQNVIVLEDWWYPWIYFITFSSVNCLSYVASILHIYVDLNCGCHFIKFQTQFLPRGG